MSKSASPWVYLGAVREYVDWTNCIPFYAIVDVFCNPETREYSRVIRTVLS